MPTLYVFETGSRIEIEYQRLLVTQEDEVLLRLPLGDITQIVVVGAVGVTTPALHRLLERNIPLLFLSARGRYLGKIATPASYHLPLRQQQFARNDDASFALQMAQSITAGKIRNQGIQAARWARRHPLPADQCQQLRQSAAQAAVAPNLPTLLGIEGNAARLYFELFQQVIPPAWGFLNRNRRPPKDPVNALLSLGYTLLTQTLSSALEVVGLDPYLGYFHTEHYGRPALALDLLEEFRAPIVDSLVASLVSHQQLTPADFETDPQNGGVYLSTHGWRIFARRFTHKLETPIFWRSLGRRLNYQKIFEVQARQLAHLIQGRQSQYRPFMAR